jgi:SAM-dependent methyltransferase
LGWLNATVRVRWKIPTDPSRFVRAVLAGASELPVAHVKVACVDPPRGAAALVRRRGAITGALVEGQPTTEATFLVNARVALPPAELEARIRESITAAASGGTLSIDELASFEPARPEPERRVLSEPEVEASCCAAFYDRPDVQYLLGDGLHPGGVDLTFRLAELLELQGGGRLLDVACGRGTSLRAIAGRYPIVGVGLDAGATSSNNGRVSLRRGDAHAIPFEDRSFDAVLCECAVSTFLMQSHATKEMARVLRPGGRLAMSDMVVDGPLPPLLAGWAENGTCLVRARSLATYAGLLRDAGLEVVNELDASSGLLEILDRIKRRLLGAALGAASGVLPAGVSFDLKPALAILREAEAAVSSGTIRYGVLVARAPS